MMEWHFLAEALLAIVLAIVGWNVRRFAAQQDAADKLHDSLEKELSDFRIEVAKDYITHVGHERTEKTLRELITERFNGLETRFNRLDGNIDLLFEKVEQKADK